MTNDIFKKHMRDICAEHSPLFKNLSMLEQRYIVKSILSEMLENLDCSIGDLMVYYREAEINAARCLEQLTLPSFYDRLKSAAINTWSFYLMEKNRERNFDFKLAGELHTKFIRIKLILRKRYKVCVDIDGDDRIVFSEEIPM